jgi:hypothetical protein
VSTTLTARHHEVAAAEGIRLVLAGLRSFWDHGRRSERVAYVIGALLCTSGAFHLGVYAIDGGSWQGPVSWRKPVTFGVSFGLTLITVTWTVSFLRLGDRTRAWLVGLFSYGCAAEVFGITFQRWRGEESHFNEETAFNDLFNKTVLAGSISIVVLVSIVLTVLSLIPATTAGLPAGIRLALGAGWLIFLAAMAFGVLMVVTATNILAAPGDDPAAQQAAYSSAGWLKPAHAITMHAVLLLPALAWLTSCAPWSPARRFRALAIATAGYTLLAIAVVAVTLLRLTPLAPPAWAAAPAMIGLAAFAAAGLQTLTAVLRGPASPGLTRDLIAPRP